MSNEEKLEQTEAVETNETAEAVETEEVAEEARQWRLAESHQAGMQQGLHDGSRHRPPALQERRESLCRCADFR